MKLNEYIPEKNQYVDKVFINPFNISAIGFVDVLELNDEFWNTQIIFESKTDLLSFWKSKNLIRENKLGAFVSMRTIDGYIYYIFVGFDNSLINYKEYIQNKMMHKKLIYADRTFCVKIL